MEWLGYKNVLENTFGLGSDKEITPARQEPQSGIHSSAAHPDESIDSTTRISRDLSILCPVDADRELQQHAYRSSGLLDSLHYLAFFGNKNGHPNNPIEDMRLEQNKEADGSQTVMDNSESIKEQPGFPSVIVSSSSDGSSFECGSFTDDDESIGGIPYPIQSHESLHKMEEGHGTPLKRVIMSKERFEELAAKNERHFRPFGHGKFWTCLSLFFAWSGVFCAVQSAHSVRFVRLQKPIQITPMYHPVERMGLLRTEICLNATVAGAEACKVIPIDSEDIRDSKFGMARLFLMLGTLFGVFFTLVLSTSVYWESINLRPVAAGFLISYFFQSLSMLFFDTEICATNRCRVDYGCVLSILAALGWIATCIATSKMDTFKILAKRQRRRQLRERLRNEHKKDLERKNFTREPSTATETTYVSQQSNSISSSIDLNTEADERSGEPILTKSTNLKRVKSNEWVKRLDPPPTVVRVHGIDPKGVVFLDTEDLHEC